MSLINLEDVLAICSHYCPDDDGTCSKAGSDLREMLDEIEALPTIEPRAKGKWDFIGDNMFMCTSCGAIYTVQQLECLKQHVTDLYIPPYCPNCGADMRWRDDD